MELPDLPEPDGWIGANDLDPDAGVEGFTAVQMRDYAEAAVLQERERILAEAKRREWAMRDESPFEEAVEEVIAAAIRQQKD